jgi:DNA ligase (NAD+)
MKKSKNIILKNNLTKDEYLINDNKLKMISKKELDNLKKNPEEYLSKLSESSMVKLIQDLNYAYYINGESLLTDDMYDYIKGELERINPSHTILKEIGVSNIRKKKLPYFMGSMDKIKNNDRALDNWIKKYPDDDGYIISDKLDGISGLLYKKKGSENVQLFTRGDGSEGQEVTHLKNFINGIPNLEMSKEIAIRGEFLITKNKFEKMKKEGDIKNARNTVAGVFNSKKPDLKIAKLIDFICYEYIIPSNTPFKQFKILEELDFNTPYHNKLNTITNTILSKILEERRNESEYDIDGIIVTQNKVNKRNTSGNPKYSFAFKNILTLKNAEIMVLKVQWNITKDKYIQPVVHFEPVEINGVMIERATGINAKFITDNKIGPGSNLIIVRRGDVIPHIERVLTKSLSGEPSMPDYKYKWNPNKIEIILDNSEIRKDILEEKDVKELENFVTKIKFDRISVGMVKKLYNADINTIYKFLNVTKEELLKINGIKEKTANNILNSIQKSIKDIDCIKLMVSSNSFGRGFGEKTFKLIYTKLDRDIIKDKPTVKELIGIKGIEIKTANKFVDNFDNFVNFLEINKLKCKFKNKSTKIENKLTNLNIVFSGIRDTELEEYIENSGGSIKNTVNKETSILVVKNLETDGSKIKTARKINKELEDKENINKSSSVRTTIIGNNKIKILTIEIFKNNYVN